MDRYDLKILEFDKIIELLKLRAYSDGAKKLAGELRPSNDISDVRRSLEDSDSAKQLVLRRGEIPLSGLSDITEIVKRSSRDATLSCAELLKIARFLRTSGKMYDYAYRAKASFVEDREINPLEDISMLTEQKSVSDLNENTDIGILSFLEYFDGLSEFSDLEKRISKAILSEDEVSDFASHDLHSIRRKIKDIQKNIRDYLDSVIRTNSEDLSDSIYTQRDGRYVIPVKSAQKSKFKGLVHDASSSGQTLFIEPLAVVENNNKIRELEIEERKEIERILFSFSQEIKQYSIELLNSNTIAVKIDFIHAKAKLAIDLDANIPEINDAGIIELLSVRHPLIPKDKIVPIDIILGTSYRSLVITGPNTGGKTVALKTCGLMTLMAMSGLLIPAKEKSKISVFSKVLADIGDEQSIEQNLSTFSAHMTHVISILKFADHESLVLLDELGSGTDPSEGAALAVAILEELRMIGCLVMSSTHYKELKVYALENDEVENASCEFDIQSLRPTYRLLIGMPGVSNAFVISQKLGLDERLIKKAKENLGSEKLSFEKVLADAENKRRQYSQAREDVERRSNELKLKEEKISREELFIKNKKDEIINSAREESRNQLRDMLKITEMLIDDIKKSMKSGNYAEADKLAKELRQSLKSEINSLDDKLTDSLINRTSNGKKLSKDELKIGELYYVPLLGKNARLLENPKGNKVLVQDGNISTRVDVRNLEPAKQSGSAAEKKFGTTGKGTSFSSQRLDKKMNFSPEIKLIGMRTDEAEVELERFIDSACLASIKQLRVVHGKGTGALRAMVKRVVNRDKRIKSSSDAPYGQGDSGVTLIELR